MKHTMSVVILTILLLSSTGCATLTEGDTLMGSGFKMFKPKPYDEPQKLDDELDDAWADETSEMQSLRESVKDPDRFWVEKVMSPQARNIERSLGIE